MLNEAELRLQPIASHFPVHVLKALAGAEAETQVTARAGVLLRQLAAGETESRELPDPAELAATAVRTLRLPEIAALRPALVPELAVWSESEGEHDVSVRRSSPWRGPGPVSTPP
jgi:hypothetical protein